MSKQEIRKDEYPEVDRAGVAGYFAWVKTPKGAPTYERYHWWRNDNTMPETKKRYEDATLQKHPLQLDEFKMDLDMLAMRYPLKQGDGSDATGSG